MKKYIRAAICIVYSVARFSIFKIFHTRNLKFSVFTLMSPFTDIDMGKNSKLFVGKMIKMRSGCKVRIRKGAEIKIGQYTSLNHGCIFTAHEKIEIGDNVQFGPNVLIYDHDHDFRQKDGLKNLVFKKSAVTIGNNVWIGANTVILRGTHIGDNCVIGAGSIVRGYIEANQILIQKRKNDLHRIDEI